MSDWYQTLNKGYRREIRRVLGKPEPAMTDAEDRAEVARYWEVYGRVLRESRIAADWPSTAPTLIVETAGSAEVASDWPSTAPPPQVLPGETILVWRADRDIEAL
jgi:hypothetical protein